MMRWSLVFVGWIGVVGCNDDGTAGEAGTVGGTADDGGGDDDGGDDGSAGDGAVSVDDGSADGTGAADATADDGGSADGPGDDGGSGSQCESDRDCPPEGQCVALVDGGVQVCVTPVVEATECADDPTGGPPPDACCNSGECEAGICVSNDYGPMCSGAPVSPYNVCLAATCTTHADCGAENMACIPAGALDFPVATCWAVECLQDSDCTASPGGICAIVPSTTCCGDDLPRCRYPDSPPITDECPP